MAPAGSRSGSLSRSTAVGSGPFNKEHETSSVDGRALEKWQKVREPSRRARDRDDRGRRSRSDSGDDSPSRSSVSENDRRKRSRKRRSDRRGRRRERRHDCRHDGRGRSSSSSSASSTSRSSDDDDDFSTNSDSENSYRRKRRRKRIREERRSRERRGKKKERKKSSDRRRHRGRREKRKKRGRRSRKEGRRRSDDSNDNGSVESNDMKNCHRDDWGTHAIPTVETRGKHGEKSTASSILDGKGGQKPLFPHASTVEDAEKERQKATASRSMAPMSREEYEAQRSVIREVYDPDTGRTRLVRGDGEIIERIVSREDHARINRLATAGDGRSFARGVSAAASAAYRSANRRGAYR